MTGSAAASHFAIGAVTSTAARRALLRSLVASVLGIPDETVMVAHEPGGPQRILVPSGAGLHLSSASRDGLAAVAIAARPIGIDVERADPLAEVPWNVLHPAETAALRDLPKADRAEAFARLWSCKEAYLKAVGIGLHRDTRTVPVRMTDAHLAQVQDGSTFLDAVTRWHDHAGSRYAISTVTLPPSPAPEPRTETTDREGWSVADMSHAVRVGDVP